MANPESTSGPEWLLVEDMCSEASIRSLPATLAPRQCFLPGTRLVTSEGVKAVEDLKSGVHLLDLEDNLVKITDVVNYKPPIERDLVTVSLEHGSFQVTSDHYIPVVVGNTHAQIEAGELKEGMMILAADGQALIHNIERHNCVTTEVVEVHLEDLSAVVCMDLGGALAGVYGAVPCKIQYRVNYLAGQLDALAPSSRHSGKASSEPWLSQTLGLLTGEGSFPLSIGSNGHPRCAGACNLYKKGLCKYAAHCDACHVSTCKKHKKVPGKNERQRRARKHA